MCVWLPAATECLYETLLESVIPQAFVPSIQSAQFCAHCHYPIIGDRRERRFGVPGVLVCNFAHLRFQNTYGLGTQWVPLKATHDRS